MARASIVLAALITIGANSLGAPPPEIAPVRPVTPPSPRPSWMSGDRNALLPPLRNAWDTTPPNYRPSIWQRVERDLDRSIWRIEDTPTYELNHLELERAANRATDPLERRDAQRELYDYERDRQEVIDNVRNARDHAKAREEMMRRREYELWLNDGLRSAIGEQATADRLALQAARQRRDADLSAATDARNQAMNGARDAGSRSAIDRDYESRRTTIEQTYQSERARILGVDPK
jgi:hypothetical protein